MNELRSRAQEGIVLLETAIIELLRQHPAGLRNSEITRILSLQSDQNGQNRDYLSWSLLGLLIKKRLVDKKGSKYVLSDATEISI